MVLFNLFLIQIKQKSHFVNMGKKQYGVTMTIPSTRAPILDCTGTQPLALNKESFAAFLLPKKITDHKKTKQFLAKNFPQALERYKRLPATTHFMYIKRKLTPEHVHLVQTCNLPEIQLLKEPSRFYPLDSAGPLIGFTDIDNNGLCGVELQYNKLLAGKPSTVWLEHDARAGHFYFAKETKIEGEVGKPITLTIDSNLQFLAAREVQATVNEFNAKEGAAIIINPRNGHIVAAVQFPTFDPNNIEAVDLEKTKSKIMTDAYELGSVMKVFTAFAALEEGLVTENELIDCENVKTTYVEGRKINTVVSSVLGLVPFSEVIERSNNIGIAKVALRLGPKLYNHYIKLGFGKKTGIELSGEQRGFVNAPAQWSKQSIISLSYGYEISATLLQLGQAFCLIARKGVPVQLTLVQNAQEVAAPTLPLYSPASIETIQRILENTTLRGSMKKAAIKGYKIMSKTGTANLLVNGLYDTTKNIYTSVGIVEKGDYQRVIVVFIKEGAKKNLYASFVTAPLFERIAEKTLIHDRVM